MEIRKNLVKERLASGESAFVVSGFYDSDSIDQFGPNKFDGIWLEGEHGNVDFSNLSDYTRACDLWGLTSIVRINMNEPGVVYRTLDRGAQGLALPHVNTREEAERFVDAAKFAPIGNRGMFISRQGYGVENYLQIANEQTLLIVLIEDIVAVNNLDEILKVDHIDVFFVAPTELAASMGYIGQPNHQDVQAVLNESLARIQDAGRISGTLATDKTVSDYQQAGVKFMMLGIGPWLQNSAQNFLAKAGR